MKRKPFLRRSSSWDRISVIVVVGALTLLFVLVNIRQKTKTEITTNRESEQSNYLTQAQSTDDKLREQVSQLVSKYSEYLRFRADVRPSRKIFLSANYGGFCNKCIALANAFDEAARNRFVLVLDFFWLSFIATNFDPEVLFKQSKVAVEYRPVYEKIKGARTLTDGVVRFQAVTGLY